MVRSAAVRPAFTDTCPAVAKTTVSGASNGPDADDWEKVACDNGVPLTELSVYAPTGLTTPGA